MNAKRKAPIAIDSIPELQDEKRPKGTKAGVESPDEDESNDFSEGERKSSTKTFNDTSVNNDQSINNLSRKKNACFLLSKFSERFLSFFSFFSRNFKFSLPGKGRLRFFRSLGNERMVSRIETRP